MKNLLKLWDRTKAEDGNATVQFVFVVPTFLLLFVSIFELGMATVRLTVLEHGMDKAMYEVRLGTGSGLGREEIRDKICAHAGMLKDCNENLLVEMAIIDRNTFDLPAVRATCIDKSEDGIPVTTDDQGGDSDLMFVRACYVIDPLFPAMGLGAMLKTDTAGNMQLVASSIFAQEPS